MHFALKWLPLTQRFAVKCTKKMSVSPGDQEVKKPSVTLKPVGYVLWEGVPILYAIVTLLCVCLG